MMSGITRFTNGFLAMPDGTAVRGDLYVSPSTGTIISGQSHFYSSQLSPVKTIDLQGNLLSPGLIDVQINGAYGVDFSELEDRTEEEYLQGLERVMINIVETGCTGFVGTIITQKEDLYKRLLCLLSPRSTPGGAHLLGYHAEGPFLHPLRRGAHSQPLLLTAPGPNPITTLEKVYGEEGLDQDGVKIITLAPDVEGVMDCVENLSKRGVVVSIGHSDATLDQAVEATKLGARMITHLFNAMPPIHHRDPGVVGMLGSTTTPYYGLIVDGLHSHPNTVRIAYGARPERCVLVTDAQSILDPNLPDGIHHWRPNVSFEKKGYRVTVAGTDTLAGSVAPMPYCIQNLISFCGITLPQALLCATKHPADMLGLGERKGHLREGWEADLCVMDWQGNVKSTWVAGIEVWKA